MKFFLFFLFTIPFLSIAQEENDFKLNSHGEVIWQKVFKIQDSSAYVKALLIREKTANLKKEYNQLSGELNLFQIRGRKYPVYSKRPTTGYVTIDFKGDRIRVTVANIMFEGIVNKRRVSVPTEIKKYCVNRDGELKTGSATQSMLNGIHEKFVSFFKPSEDTDKW